jgi:hypothetical protein
MDGVNFRLKELFRTCNESKKEEEKGFGVWGHEFGFRV